MENLKISIYIVLFGILMLRIYEALKPKWTQKIKVVVADTGVGKTSFVVAWLLKHFKKFNNYIYQKINKKIISKLNINGYSNLVLPEILAHSDIDIILDKKNNIKTNTYKFEDLTVLLDHEFAKEINFENYLPIGSYCIFDEVANKADSRESSTFSKGLSALMNLHRKGYYDFTFIYPHFQDVDLRIRKAAHELIYINKQYHILSGKETEDGDPIPLVTIWDYTSYTGKGRSFDVESKYKGSYLLTFLGWFLGFDLPIKRKIRIFFGNIFEHYDSRRELAYFLKNVYQYKSTTQPDFEYSRKFVNKFCELNPCFVADERTRSGRRRFMRKKQKEKEKVLKEQKRQKSEQKTTKKTEAKEISKIVKNEKF